MNHLKITLLAFCLSGLSSLSLAETATNTMQATAKVNAMCTIKATGVGFGMLMTPLSSQSASSNMKVLCTKETSYTIDLAYGGVYGTGEEGDGTWWEFAQQNNSYTFTYIQKKPGGTFGQTIGYRSLTLNQHNAYATTLGCSGPSYRCTTSRTSYDYGKMIGAGKGDNVAYAIYVPGEPTKVWNSGKNSYKTAGTGVEETIPIQAQIVPSQSGSPYPAADMYTDTVTATITY